jgi:hypothetical protein
MENLKNRDSQTKTFFNRFYSFQHRLTVDHDRICAGYPGLTDRDWDKRESKDISPLKPLSTPAPLLNPSSSPLNGNPRDVVQSIQFYR